MTLQDRTIIITGATSGIGAATALACAAEGMHVVLGGRRPDRLEAMQARIEKRGVRAATVAGDVLDEDNVPRLLEAAESLGGLDVVFSNAGYGTDMPTLHMTDEDVRRMFDVNFFRSLDLVRAAAHRLIEVERPGHLLMCSSCLAKFTLVGYAVYSASKAAQNHVCRSLRHELRPHGIEVASVHPITTRTEFFQVAHETAGKSRPESSVPDHTPGLFVQTPERVANAIVACLKRPRAEVWTSTIVRMTSAMMTAFPSFGDRVMRKSAKADGKGMQGTEEGS